MYLLRVISMKVKKTFPKDCILLDLKSHSKKAVIEEILDRLVSIGRIESAQRDEVLQALMDREEKMSTGMQRGIAIPHCKTTSVEEMVVALAVSREGIDFNSLDGEPSRIFVMTISPTGRTGPHLQFLAEISRVLNGRDVQQRILNAKTQEDVLKLF